MGRPKGSKNATPSQLRERARDLLKEAKLKEKINKIRSEKC